MKIISVSEFLKLDNLEKIKILKKITKGNIRLKERKIRYVKSECHRNKGKRNIRVLPEY